MQIEGYFTDRDRMLHGIAFSEFVSFIEEIVINATYTILAFKLLNLIKLRDAHLIDLRITLETRTHSTRFTNHLLSQFLRLVNS